MDTSEHNAEALREDGLAPLKLPEWKTVVVPERDPMSCEITKYTSVTVTYGKDGNGHLSSFICGINNPAWPRDGNPAEQRLATLQFGAAEIERVLPILRAMIENTEGTA